MSIAAGLNKPVVLIVPILSLVIGFWGVLSLGWDWRQMIVLYWFSNITVGITSLIDMFRSSVNIVEVQKGMNFPIPPASVWVAKLIASGFFCLHYGIFTLVHGIFVFAIADGAFTATSNLEPINMTQIILSWLAVLVISILLKFVQPTPAQDLMAVLRAPYKRIIVLHLSIIFGAFVVQLIGLPSAAALLLVGLNSVLELVWAKRDFAKQPVVMPQSVQP